MGFKSSLSTSSVNLAKQRGFTLVEIIIGIVVLSIALAIVSSLIVPTEEKSADNILQVKAAELGQSMLNDISSRAFDHKSDMAGGRIRCGEPDDGTNSCTDEADLGFEAAAGETANDSSTYNDVDDYNGYNEKRDVQGVALDNSYSSFIISVEVSYAGEDLGLAHTLAKRIVVTVTTPLGTEIKFATHKANF
ncbi:MSHA biogenesis protein MshD [Colwellia asteriadis]|uniref:MSHA biogenesis protein MshD n=1 Tax=Colwellia asteriadis TaxID=517723 RepID=A0ABP3WCJ4_9GAMM